MLLNACGTIISGSTTTITLQPSLQGVKVRADVVSKGMVQEVELPTTVMLKKSPKAIQINIKDDCYQATTYAVEPTLNMWFLGNIITGGTTGTTTDAVTGALWTYDELVTVPVSKKPTCK